MRFDEKSIGRLDLPEGKRELMVFDDSLPGFGIRLREGGKKTWVLQYRVGRQQRRKTLGTPTELSLRAARDQARADLAKVRLGGDPQRDKADGRRRPDDTLESTTARFLRKQRSELKPRSYEQAELHLTKHWAPLKAVSIQGITRSDIANQLGKIAEDRGPYAANRARATLSAFYSWAIGEGLCGANPTIGTNRNDGAQARSGSNG